MGAERMSELLTVGDVAELCKVNAKTVQRAIRAGRLRASQLGARGAYRVRPEDVDAWIDGSRVPAVPLAAPVALDVPPLRARGGRLVVREAVRS